MVNALPGKEPEISYQLIVDSCYHELITLATKRIPYLPKAEGIVKSNIEKVKEGLHNYNSLSEIKAILYIMISQDCEHLREYAATLHKKAYETHYHQLVFYLGYFATKGNAALIADITFKQLEIEYFNYGPKCSVELYIKSTAISLCLKDLETMIYTKP